MPDVSSNAPTEVRMRAALDVHKHTIVCASCPDDPRVGDLELQEVPNTERALRRLVKRLGGRDGLILCYEAGPCGYDPLPLLYGARRRLRHRRALADPACPGFASQDGPPRHQEAARAPPRRGALVRGVTDARAGGLRDLVRCRDDLRDARMRARHRVAKQLPRHGRRFEGKKGTKAHQAWVACQRLDDPNSQRALCHMLAHLESLDAQLAALDSELEQIATREPWSDPVRWLTSFRGIGTLSAPSLLAEIGDFRRFHSPRELMAFLGLTPSEYSSGEERHRGQITKTGNRDARRLLVEAAWHYQHAPRLAARVRTQRELVPPAGLTRAWTAQMRLNSRHRALVERGKRSTVANVAVARELCGFIWAAMTQQPLREEVAT